MSGLSPDARRLLDAARAADRTTPADRTRVRAALRSRLALSAAAAAAPASASLLAKAVAGGALLVAATVGVGAARTPPDRPHRAPYAAIAHRVSPPRAAPAPSIGPAPTIAPVAPAPTPTPTPPRPAPTRVVCRALRPGTVASPAAVPTVAAPAPVEPSPAAPDESAGLADELSRLGDAQIALDQRHGERALRLLDAYVADHPQGALWEESAALRVLALCALGRPAEARESAAALLRDASRSPAAARVRASCVGAVISTRIDGPPVIP